MGKGEEREKEKRKNFLIHNTILFNWVYRKKKKKKTVRRRAQAVPQSLRTHGLKHIWLPYPSLSPRDCPGSYQFFASGLISFRID